MPSVLPSGVQQAVGVHREVESEGPAEKYRAVIDGKTQDEPVGLRQALASEFGAEPAMTSVSDRELARRALLVLAEDPDTGNAIETMASQPQSLQKVDFGASIALTAAVQVVLQTRVKIERGRDGKYSLLVEKKPTRDALLKSLVQKLLSYAK